MQQRFLKKILINTTIFFLVASGSISLFCKSSWARQEVNRSIKTNLDKTFSSYIGLNFNKN